MRTHDATPPLAARLEQLERTLFFLVGCGRSGTTLLQAILLRHPDIAIPPETKFLAKFPARTPRLRDIAADAAHDRALDAVIADQQRKGVAFDPQRFREYAHAAPRTWEGLLLALLAAAADAENKPRVGEKSPTHTPHIGRLARAFPHARFVHILRDPRAVMLSRIRAGFTSGMLGTEIPRWRQAARAHALHADALGPHRYLLVRYEDLVRAPEPSINAICAFLGIHATPEMLTPHDRDTPGFPDRSAEWMRNTLRPIFLESIDHWKTALSPAQIALIEHALADDMRAMGYEPTGAVASAPDLRLALSRAAGDAVYFKRKLGRGARRVLRMAAAPSQHADA